MPIGIDKNIGVKKAMPNKPYLRAVLIANIFFILLFFTVFFLLDAMNLYILLLKKEKIKILNTPPTTEKRRV